MSNQAELLRLLKRPIITEKSTQLVEMGQYVFEVAKHARKPELAQAFKLAFPGREVEDVRIIKMPSHAKRVGRRVGRTPERKKAVFTISGEPLDLFTGV